jgi:hypothetical protein
MAKKINKKNIVTEITLTLADGGNLKFQPKHKTLVKILRGTMEINEGNFINKVLNNKEAIVIINAPEEVLELFGNERDIWKFIEERLNK